MALGHQRKLHVESNTCMFSLDPLNGEASKCTLCPSGGALQQVTCFPGTLSLLCLLPLVSVFLLTRDAFKFSVFVKFTGTGSLDLNHIVLSIAKHVLYVDWSIHVLFLRP